MASKKIPVGESTRSLALLWGPHTTPGRSGLTIKAIVSAAMEIADTQGMSALSMRSVAERLGAGAMSLYTHVPGKSELLDLMFDRAFAQLYESVQSPAGQPGGWRGALRFIARKNWEVYQRHPWMLHLPAGRPVIGPNVALKYEAELRPLDNLGLSDLEMDAALTLLLTHVEGCARARAAIDQTLKDTGVSDLEWWTARAPLLEQVMNPADFPVSGRVGSATGEEYQGASNPEFVFEFGLERILAGIAELIAAKKAGRGAA